MNNPMIKGEATNLMSEASLYVTRATVEKIDGLHRRGVLEDGTALEFGVHGPIKAHYGLCLLYTSPSPRD